jgi:electron transport complex protein RnfC
MHGGIYFKPDRDIESLPIEDLPAPPAVTIPLVQYRETPARPVVNVGDHVAAGQMIGEPADDSGASLHASVSGTVTALSRCRGMLNRPVCSISIENDGKDEFASPISYDKPWQEAEPAELLAKIRLSGIIDWNGGTGVPLHTKLAAAQGKKIDALIINALATEPYCSADLRLCIEPLEKLATGIAICRKIAGASECMVAVGEGMPKALQAGSRLPGGFSLVRIRKAKYPLHDERFVAHVCEGNGRRSMVISAAAAASAGTAMVELVPSYHRVVTVVDSAAALPKYLRVRIGTPLKLLLEAAGVDAANMQKLVAGGPLTGSAVQDPGMPVTKATAALLAFGRSFPGERQYPCIGCRRCRAVCPMRLWPSRLAMLVQTEDSKELDKLGIMECIECGCCSYVCPSQINLVHYLTMGKQRLRERTVPARGAA